MSAQQTINNWVKHRTIQLSTVLLLLALLIAVLSAWPLISEPGFLNTRGGGDSPFLLQRVQQLESALRDGHFPVRWMPDANYGYGYPFFNYYAPLSIYIAVVFRFLGFSIVRSIELAQVTGFLIAAWGMFLLARRWLKSDWAGFLAAVAYTVAPFHLVNIYVRGDSLAEFWAMAWYPWIFLALDQLLENQGSRFPFGRVAAFALAYSALILSHNISALIFSPFLLLYLFLRVGAWLYSPEKLEQVQLHQSRRKIVWAILLAILLALALSAWFFLPALAEEDLAQLGPITSGYFHYSNHFRGLDLIQDALIFDYSVGGGRAFRVGLVQAICTFLGLLVLIVATYRRWPLSQAATPFILISFAVATFMIMPLSRILWDHLPLLSFTQFPWRFLSVQAFAAALATAALALLPVRRLLVPVAAIILIVTSLIGLRTDHLLLADQDITPRRLAEYEWFTGNIGSTVSAEYLPSTVQPRPYSSSWLTEGKREDLRALEGDLLYAQPLEWRTSSQIWQVTTAELGATLILPTLYWPGWQAAVDGQRVEIQPAPGSGLIAIDLPPGEHVVELHLGKTPVRWLAEIISLMALLAIIVLVIKAWKWPRLTAKVMVPLLALLVALILVRFWPQKPISGTNMTWDFAQMGYLHHDQAGVQFDNGLVLEGYEIGRETVAPGEFLPITLRFSGFAGQAVELALGSPATGWPAFDPDAPIVVAQKQTVDGKDVHFNLALPDNAPPGLTLPRIRIANAQPLMPSGDTRGDIYLQPVYVSNFQPATQSGPELDVRALNMRQRDPDTLEVQVAWSTQRQLSHNYNLSLRLLDSDGQWLAQRDLQPGYGFLPSSTWPQGKEVNDWLALSLPPDLPTKTRLPLVLLLYEVESGEAVLSRRLGDVTLAEGQLTFHENEPVFNVPDDTKSLPAIFGDSIQLRGYQIERTGSEISLTLYWESLVESQADYTRFVHLYDPQTGEIVTQTDGQPRNDSYSTAQWVMGEIVADTIMLDLSSVPPASYRLGVGFYRQEGNSLLQLAAIDPETGDPIPANRAVLPDSIDWLNLGD